MKLTAYPRTRRRTGFTLVEMMVSLAVLSLMLLALASAMNYVTRLWLSGVGTVDNYGKARLMLTLMDRDIQMMVLRRDLAAFTDNTGAQPACAFYTMVQGNPVSPLSSPDTRALSLVQYQLVQQPGGAPTSSVLQRYNCGMNFVASGTIPSVGNSTSLSQLTSTAFTSTTPDSVATGVVAFQWQFVNASGTILTPPPTGTYLFSYDFLSPGDPTNPRAVVISMVVLSNPAYTVATQTGTLGNLIGCFSASNAPLSSANATYSQAWNAVLAAPTPAFLALPEPVRDGVQVFQRQVPLPITTPSS